MPSRLSSMNCSLARTLDVVGDSWSLLIVRDAFLGSTRFSEFQRSLGVAKNILAERLERLVGAGILDKHGDDARPRYGLSEAGQALLPALAALMQWGDRYRALDGPPMLLGDVEGRSIAPIRISSEAGPLDARSIRFRPGPGADARTRAFLSARSERPSPVTPHDRAAGSSSRRGRARP